MSANPVADLLEQKRELARKLRERREELKAELRGISQQLLELGEKNVRPFGGVLSTVRHALAQSWPDSMGSREIIDAAKLEDPTLTATDVFAALTGLWKRGQAEREGIPTAYRYRAVRRPA